MGASVYAVFFSPTGSSRTMAHELADIVSRELSLPRMQARDAAGELVARSEDGIVALVFGNETSGMTNDMKDGFPVYTSWDDPHPPEGERGRP